MARRQPRTFDRKFIPLSTRFDHALLFAAQVHRDQDRKKSGIPYISHLLGVASIVLDYGGNEEMAIAALLHDAVEDQGGRPMLKMIEQKPLLDDLDRVVIEVEHLSGLLGAPPKPHRKLSSRLKGKR